MKLWQRFLNHAVANGNNASAFIKIRYSQIGFSQSIIRTEKDIAELLLLPTFCSPLKTGRLKEQANERIELIFRIQSPTHIAAYHIVCAHALHQIDREIMYQTTIHHQAIAAPINGGKNGGNRHTRSHRHRQIAFIQHHAYAIHYIGCHAFERNGELVEITDMRYAEGQFMQQIHQILTFIDA